MQPPNWSHDWYKNMNRILDWVAAVKTFCQISSDDYTAYALRKACDIKDSHVQECVIKYSANFAYLLKWIEAGVQLHNECKRVPESCTISFKHFSKQHADLWQQHILKDYIIGMDIVVTTTTNIESEIKSNKEAFENE